MDRRRFLAGAGALSVGGLAGCASIAETIVGDTRGERIEQRTVDVLGADREDASALDLPVDGAVTVIDLFATWCAPCKPTLDRLADARRQVPEDVTFVSVTSEVLTADFTEADVLSWWDEHGGPWTVAHAPASVDISRHLEARSLPTTIVTDPDRREVWRHTGEPRTETLVAEIEAGTD